MNNTNTMKKKQWKKHFEGMSLTIIKREIKELEEAWANIDDICWSVENEDMEDYTEEKLRQYKKERSRRVQRIKELNKKSKIPLQLKN